MSFTRKHRSNPSSNNALSDLFFKPQPTLAGAKPFDMEATWTQKLVGVYKIDNFLYFDDSLYKWTGP